MAIYYKTESSIDSGLMRKVFEYVGIECIIESLRNTSGGKDLIFRDDNWEKFSLLGTGDNQMFILVDLDTTQCVSHFLASLVEKKKIPEQKPKKDNLHIFVAVREIEMWLMADLDGFQRFFGLASIQPVQKIIQQGEYTITDPKAVMKQCISDKGHIKYKRLLEREQQYFMIVQEEYIQDVWSVERAMKHSPSLTRMVGKIQQICAPSNISG